MAQLLKMVEMIKTRIGSKPKRRVLLTMFDGRASLSKQVVKQVRDYFKDEVYQSVIPRNVKLAEAPARQKPIALHDPESTGAEAYKKFAAEVMNDKRPKRKAGDSFGSNKRKASRYLYA